MTAVRIGLDIGGTKAHGVAVDASAPHEVLAQVRRPSRRGPAGVVAIALECVKLLRETLDQTVGESGGSVVELVSVGVGVPGAVDGAGVLTNAVNLEVIDALDLAGELSSALSVPVTVNNDVNAAARGVATWLAGRGEPEDVALLSVGTGLAAGLVLDGRLRRGARGLVGEIGHLAVVPDGPRCSCGQHGCLELYASGLGLAQQWPYEGPGSQPVALFDAADAGDEVAIAVRDSFLGWLAEAIRIVTLSVDPARIVLTGGVLRLGDRLMDPLFALLDTDESASPFVASLRLRERTLALPPDNPAAALGAAELSADAGHEGGSPWRS